MPKDTPKAIALHACGFEDENTICQVARARAEEVIRLARLRGIEQIIITGGVRFRSGSVWLAELIRQNIFNNLFDPSEAQWPNLYILTNCFNSSTDTQAVITEAKANDIEEIAIVSSYWHHWVLQPMYGYWTRRLGFQGKLTFVSPSKDPAGIKTILAYACYSLVFHLAFRSKTFPRLDQWLNDKQWKRKDYFPVSGCD